MTDKNGKRSIRTIATLVLPTALAIGTLANVDFSKQDAGNGAKPMKASPPAAAPAVIAPPKGNPVPINAQPAEKREPEVNGRPENWLYGIDIVDIPSPAYNKGNGRDINKIVLHTTEGGFRGAMREFMDSAFKKSAHYMVRTDGIVVRLVSDDDIAWHVHDQNSDLLGIEMVGHHNLPITAKQTKVTARLAMYLMEKYNLTVDDIVAHSSLDDKRDPGEQNMRAVIDYLVNLPGDYPCESAKGGSKRYHVVDKGETLWGLSRQYNMSVDDLMDLNGLTGPSIEKYDILRID